MGIGVVPALKARVLAVEFVKNNPRIKALLDHPAGPFTSECSLSCPLTVLIGPAPCFQYS